ncbi:MAG: glycosyltransferase family 2 protein [Acidobacteria bacterium]|nr:glycosyltransferase family 2 protein [Acidobacteriota bacterium]MCG2815308.1 glycosyltransferase family 2 protein [Candidatus Aminicenantes bacterium]MBU1338371.1 glycosyltransferase family 2 protein [Acidobacteriota bacterium]MBU1474989.1 glycosyltransferase family 2 protein [Acidobacteriota bacterium]MBU2438678.1 glycosyltransferase family 2 protein [Acidobacteriota bacterium]
MKISVVIITFNEEKRLEPALKSVHSIAEEIIVVDSLSTDETIRIAQKYTDKIYKRKWTNYADQKNFANEKARFPWILSLDADERLSPELRREIEELLPEEPDCTAFSMPRVVYYFGRWIRHSGWYPDRKVRLFRKEAARWEGEFVHESLVVDGEIRKLKGDLHHFTYKNIRQHLARINDFSDLGAQKLYVANKKSRICHLVFLPLFRFVRSYFFKAGFRDGFAGFVIAVLHGYAIFARYAKLREIWKIGEKIEPVSN